MSQKTKLKLRELTPYSFITNLNRDQKNKINGGDLAAVGQNQTPLLSQRGKPTHPCPCMPVLPLI